MLRAVLSLTCALTLAACGGATIPGIGDGGGSSSSGSSSGGSGSGSGGSSSSSSSGGVTSREPLNHRPNDAACFTSPAKGDCPVHMGPGMCTSDGDCSAGKNGRCVESGGGALYCACSYDSCASDVACSAGQTCACHGSPYVGGAGNTCVPGDCRVDADCGAGGFCSPSAGSNDCGGLAGYYCHTPLDQCVDDTDCQGQGQPQGCQYAQSARRWQCTPLLFCG